MNHYTKIHFLRFIVFIISLALLPISHANAGQSTCSILKNENAKFTLSFPSVRIKDNSGNISNESWNVTMTLDAQSFKAVISNVQGPSNDKNIVATDAILDMQIHKLNIPALIYSGQVYECIFTIMADHTFLLDISSIKYSGSEADICSSEITKDDIYGTNIGTCRLFFTLDAIFKDANRVLRSAISTDGVNFTFEDEVWLESTKIGDPAVRIGTDNVWRIVTGTFHTESIMGIRYASHADTSYFEEPTLVISDENFHYGSPDMIDMDGGWRIYFMGGGIKSAFTTDGENFTLDEGVRLTVPEGMAGIGDPSVARRSDGTYVMYFKAMPAPEDGGSDNPYKHIIYRAFSNDGLNWTHENIQQIQHAGVPAVYTDASGRVWVYFLYFPDDWPKTTETIWVAYEKDDGTLSTPEAVNFTGGIPDNYWTNNPSPVLLNSGQ